MCTRRRVIEDLSRTQVMAGNDHHHHNHGSYNTYYFFGILLLLLLFSWRIFMYVK